MNTKSIIDPRDEGMEYGYFYDYVISRTGQVAKVGSALYTQLLADEAAHSDRMRWRWPNVVAERVMNPDGTWVVDPDVLKNILIAIQSEKDFEGFIVHDAASGNDYLYLIYRDSLGNIVTEYRDGSGAVVANPVGPLTYVNPGSALNAIQALLTAMSLKIVDNYSVEGMNMETGVHLVQLVVLTNGGTGATVQYRTTAGAQYGGSFSTWQPLARVNAVYAGKEAFRYYDNGAGMEYLGYALSGTLDTDPSWAICRVKTISSSVYVQWADGNQNFDQKWDDGAGNDYSTYAYS